MGVRASGNSGVFKRTGNSGVSCGFLRPSPFLSNSLCSRWLINNRFVGNRDFTTSNLIWYFGSCLQQVVPHVTTGNAITHGFVFYRKRIVLIYHFNSVTNHPKCHNHCLVAKLVGVSPSNTGNGTTIMFRIHSDSRQFPRCGPLGILSRRFEVFYLVTGSIQPTTHLTYSTTDKYKH